ncbi:hypothetical protein E8L99_07450 [Phreatobacter aquaticus]|uniref:Uncharacterized protein n=1 Tax=Phreatobacter aquaticus TaxID=2570229 RepID=A0A4D7QFH8_9HYPH|nr:hypothetical protein [Phreatobacter aquaticus]QCK85615.1 hypothetical protein E8L99_07450 [Phreatobacter aquaticus]
MLLGDLLARLHDATIAEQTLASLNDLILAATVSQRAVAAGVPLGTFAAEQVESYADGADDSEWTTVMGLMARADDPGAVLLRRALNHSGGAAASGCSCGGKHA